MPHDNDVNIEKGTGVGTDGSLQSAKEDFFDHGADHSAEEGAGVGTDGSLPEEAEVRDATDPAYPGREEGIDPHRDDAER
ncbi:MAG TPA: hypothetical protein VGP26_15350 [Actinophytocola sp.]|jgi:hypothetical protein|nr:hypothetical protein [Actinophytocola sp.]